MRIRTSYCIIGLSALALAACAPTPGVYDPVSGGYVNENQRAQTGALTGAAIGAAIGGSQRGGNRLGQAAVGGVIGAALGGAIGANLDRQAAELRNSVGSNIDVRNTGNELIVTMPQDILFATDSAVVRADLQRDLRAIAGNLISYPNSTIQIVGHTDSTGTAAYNQNLSERRANAVAAVLRDSGVPSSRIVAYGRGQDQPVASNATAEGRMQNRRVEIIIRPTS
ncbi:OmpA family protein [Plastorhodobacter daqingensis]|uniref:OmpA family protein n=1 Tax=Plastorhodobacter daqingensis TaxID=1387281 RepID=A0ABW2UHV2_9RHOB